MPELIEIRFHGRGGQGAWTSSRLLAEAALLEGKYVQSFPEFGPERMGAPIQAYTRISDAPIRIHSQVYEPDYVVVLDRTLLKSVRVNEGLKKALILNSPTSISKIPELNGVKVYVTPATEISLEILRRNAPSTAVLGALIGIAPLVSMESLLEVTVRRFKGEIGERNKEVIKRAYEEVKPL